MMKQPDLFTPCDSCGTPINNSATIDKVNAAILDNELHLTGAVYSPLLDKVRLGKQAQAIYDVMSNGKWMTLSEIEDRVWEVFKIRAPGASVSAQIRNISRPPINIKHTKRRRGEPTDGLWEYQLILNK